jgi:GT2 family glycosyltransferase
MLTSLIIPVTDANADYTDNIVKNIREIYPSEDEVEIVLQKDSNVTLGINYNNAVARAKGNKIILLHNDMVIKPGFVETMNKHIAKNRVTTYTRVEPPIFPDTYPGKVILDCGTTLETFDQEKFNSYQIEESLTDGGTQLFFGCLKEDYIGIDGYNFKKFCEDDDLHARFKLARFEHKVSSAHVYHFVSKTSRQGDYHEIEMQSNKNFIRKWGSRNYTIKYNVAFEVRNCNLALLEVLEPWCDRIYVKEVFEIGRAWDYVEMERGNTEFDLSKRVMITDHNDSKSENDIVVEFDAKAFGNEQCSLLQQLPQIISESGEVGVFELDIFKITINALTRYEQNLIKLV